jgi:hypothetical protein
MNQLPWMYAPIYMFEPIVYVCPHISQSTQQQCENMAQTYDTYEHTILYMHGNAPLFR